MLNSRTRITALAALFLLTAACAEDTDQDTAPDTAGSTLSLEFEALPDLGADFVYEGWIIVDDAPVTTGRFTSDSMDLNFEVTASDAAAATAFVLTIEPAVGDDPGPSDVHVVAGDLVDGEAMLSIDHPAALDASFGDAEGSFILNTPSSGDTDDDFAQGIWWLDPTMGPGPSLELPPLAKGWVYEGWVVFESGPVSTGRFTSMSGADSDGAGPTAGPDSAPPFPGQDYIDPAQNLVGLTAVISVEPNPDNSPMPFDLKPLVGPIEDEGIGVAQSMMNNSGGEVSGMVTID